MWRCAGARRCPRCTPGRTAGAARSSWRVSPRPAPISLSAAVTVTQTCRTLQHSTAAGCATILWLLQHRPEEVAHWDRCGTVMDFIVSGILETDVVTTSNQNAASFGYFDCLSGDKGSSHEICVLRIHCKHNDTFPFLL